MDNHPEEIENLRRLVHLDDLATLALDSELAEDITDQRRWWVRPINKRRNEQGASEQLVREMRLYDDEAFFYFTRMSMDQFDNLLELVRHLLDKQNTRKDVLSPSTRLLITLR